MITLFVISVYALIVLYFVRDFRKGLKVHKASFSYMKWACCLALLYGYLMAALRLTKWEYSMSLRIDMKHIRTALHVMAYGASDVYTKRLLTRCRKMTARQAAVAVKWARITLLSYQ